MKTSMKKSLIALVIPALFVACSKSSDGNNPADNTKEAIKDPSLQGKIFRGECSLKPLENIATGIVTGGSAVIRSGREQYQFVGNNLTHTTSLYGSTDCSAAESIIFKETGVFTIDDSQKTADGGIFIDLKYDHLMVRADDGQGAQLARDIKLCDTDQWEVGTERDVTDKARELTCYRKAVPSEDANLYKLDGTVLYFGKKNIFDRNSDRPTELNTDEKFAE